MGQLVLSRGLTVTPPPGARVLKAADYARLLEAEGILAEARREADSIRAAAVKEAAERRAEGHAEGLRQGKDESAAHMLRVLEQGRDYLQENEGRVVTLVLAVLKKVLGDMDGKEVVVRMVRTAMALVSRQSQVRVMVAPALVEAVKSELAGILAPYPNVTTVEVAGDPALSEGRCVLETRAGRVESSLEAQIRTIARTLTDTAPGRKERLEKELRAFEAELAKAMAGGAG
jgi:type III secretion protein L